MKSPTCLSTAIFSILLLGSGAAAAGDWGAGLVAGAMRKPYRGVGTDTIALPLVTYRNEWVSIMGPGIDVRLLRGDGFGIDLRTRYENNGYEAKDSPFLQGMAERKGSFWMGPAAQWQAGPVTVSLEWLSDASRKSKGSKAKLEFERHFAAGALQITPRIAAHWSDKKVVDYYYGVTVAEARTGRAFYQGRAASSAEAGLRLTYALGSSQQPRHIVFLDLSTTVHGAAIKDSPLLDKKRESSAFTGYIYNF